jgi:hypothetical protein
MIVPYWTSYESTSWGLWTLDTTASIVPTLTKVEGTLGRGGVLVPMGAQTREGGRSREGLQCECLQS